jgi:uncharacterized membrane protein
LGDPSLERIVLFAVVLFTLAFVLVTPPFQAPDEPQHFMKAVQLSQGSVFAEVQGRSIGKSLPRTMTALYGQDFVMVSPGIWRLYHLRDFPASWRADAGRSGQEFANFPNMANYAPTLYLPQAIGIRLATVLGLPAIAAFYVARLANACVALMILVAALRVMPFARLVILAVAALPTTVFQAASLSPDATINAVAFLTLALTLNVGTRLTSGAPVRLLPVASVLLGLAKGVYLPVILAGLSPSGPTRQNRPWLVIGCAAIGAAVFVAWMKASGGTQATYGILARKSGLFVQTVPFMEQLSFILRDPLGFAGILLSSIAERMPVYALQMVGRFGWNAILLPLLAYPLALAMLIAALWGSDHGHIAIARRLWWLALAIGSEFLIEIALYLTGTPPGADYIQGVQGRYLIPLLPLVGLALLPPAVQTRRTIVATRIFAGAAILLLSVAFLSALDSFWIHGFVTSDGLPPMQAGVSGILRALLLPSPRW